MTPLPAQRFPVLLVDPPWRFKTYSAKGRGRSPDGPRTRNQSRENSPARHYETMALIDIKRLPVGELAAPDAALFLWAIDPMLPHAFGVAASWGFSYSTVAFYWVKERRATSTRDALHDEPDHKRFPIGTGYWTRANPEACLLFTRGSPKRIATDVRKLIIAPRREHSRKPDETHARIERLIAGPYLELFARESRPGWVTWGAESTKFDGAKNAA